MLLWSMRFSDDREGERQELGKDEKGNSWARFVAKIL